MISEFLKGVRKEMKFKYEQLVLILLFPELHNYIKREGTDSEIVVVCCTPTF